jgi:hypothetical protein
VGSFISTTVFVSTTVISKAINVFPFHPVFMLMFER